MANQATEFLLSGTHAASGVLSALKSEFKLEAEPQRTVSNIYHDTFDWRLYLAGTCMRKESEGDQHKKGFKGTDEELFNGLFWSGRESIELGLADAIGSAGYVARDVVGVEEIVDFTSEEDALSRLVDRLGAAVGAAFARVTGLDGMQLR